MNNYDRIFGSGPVGVLASLLLLYLAFYLKDRFDIPGIFIEQEFIRTPIFMLFTVIACVIIIWSTISLNPKLRGRTLVTTGAFRYFRHPLYAAFLSSFNFGLAVLLNNWVFIIWAILLHPIWHLIIIHEEKILKIAFPNDYEEYCRNTGRFFPKFTGKKQ